MRNGIFGRFLPLTSKSREHYGDDNGGSKEPNPEAGNAAPHESADQAIARYNFWLMVFTGVLAFVSFVQIGFLIRADATSEKAAQAAHDAVEVGRHTLEVSQRAILTTDDWDLRLDSFGPNLGPQLVFNLINSGPTPAETISASFQSRIDSKLPETPDWAPLVPDPGFVRPNFKITLFAEKLNPLSLANYNAIVEGRYFIWVYGRIVYRDIFKKTYELGFAVKTFLIKDKEGNITGAKFEMPKLNGYNYLVERTDEREASKSKDFK